MKLVLTNGYPYPYPENLSEAESEAIASNAGGNRLEIPNVISFQWLHTVTVQLRDDFGIWLGAQQMTGWEVWDDKRSVLEAKTSSEDGYGHPAIIVGDMAYCGFMLLED
jgi:hypothetical protein